MTRWRPADKATVYSTVLYVYSASDRETIDKAGFLSRERGRTSKLLNERVGKASRKIR